MDRLSSKILTSVDQSRRDATSLPYAIRMAKVLDASVTVVQSVPLTRSLIPSVMRQAEAYVGAVEEGLREQGVAAESVVRRGDPASVIVSLATELQADLVIITTRGRSRLEKFVLGSVASAVLTNCPRPVLILKEAEESIAADEKMRHQSAYLATVVWNRHAKGLCTEEEAEGHLYRLATMGLDRSVLLGTYQACKQGGKPFDWLDFDFQLSTLRQFLPEEADPLARGQPPDSRNLRAA